MSTTDKIKALFDTPRKMVVFIIAAIAVIQIMGASRLGFGVDEAHYALYGRFPALSYFDHPPMTGWLQWLMLHIGSSELVLRLLPIVMLALSAWLLYGLTCDLYPHKSAWLGVSAVVAMQSGIMFHLIGLGMLPDGPLLLFGLAAMRLLVRIAKGGSGVLWLWLGILMGLAALSKYTAITLVISAALTVLFFARWQELRKPWLWLGATIALLLCLPIVIWNLQNDWISIRYQIDHGTGQAVWSIGKFMTTQAAQFGAYSPGHYVLGWLAVIIAIKKWRRIEMGDKLCLLFGLPVLLLFGFSGGYERGLPHWPALGWAAVMPLTVKFVWEHWQQSRALRIAVRLALGYCALVLLLLHLLGHLPLNPFPAYKYPLQDLIGWDEAAARAVSLRRQMDAEHSDANAVVFVRRWTHASRLGWYSWPEPLSVLSDRNKQFHIWYGEPVDGQNGILVLYERKATSPEAAADRMQDRFDKIDWLESLQAGRGGKAVAIFHFYRCFGLKQ